MDMSQVNGRIRELVESGQEKAVCGIIRAELTEYYSTIEGREELMNSPNKHLKVAEAVDLLMQGVPKRVEREVKRRDG